MGKSKVKKQQIKKPAQAVSKVVETTAQKVESNALEVIGAVNELFKKYSVSGYVLAIADKTGKILPYASGASVGDILTLQYVLDKEIARLIDRPANQEKTENTAQ